MSTSSAMQTSVKEEARRLVESLSEDTTWDELMQTIYARQAIEDGLSDSRAARGVPVEEVRARFGLEP